MREVTKVQARPIPVTALGNGSLRNEARQPKHARLIRAWLLYFEDAEKEPLRGRGEALQIEDRIRIGWFEEDAWGNMVSAGDEPDWLQLKTDQGEPLIQCLVGREPQDGPWLTSHGRRARRRAAREARRAPPFWKPRS